MTKAGKHGMSPRLYSALLSDPQNPTFRILVETERLLRIYGHRKIRVADIAGACKFSAANVYRFFPSRRAILNTLASHYLREATRTALACAIRKDHSARDRLSGFLAGLSTTLIIFVESEPKVGEVLADASTEQWPCYSHYSARVVRCIAKIVASARASGEFGFEAGIPQQAEQIKAAACALVEPDVIRLCRNRHNSSTCVALSRLVADALLNQAVAPRELH
jgi:AcrR family transcriptional regulator